MRIRWEPGPADAVTYFVDDVPVGTADAGFDEVLDLVESHAEPVTLEIRSIPPGGGDLDDALPFGDRLEELRRRLGARQARYEPFGWAGSEPEIVGEG
ncbi:MAG: hypothetical protein ACRDLS_01810 [Solirubrobacteraceae bacterium]